MSELEFILWILSCFFIGYTIGKFVGNQKIVKTMITIADKYNIDLIREIELLKNEPIQQEGILVYKLEVETHGDSLYLYDRDTDTFICQGKTLEDLAKDALKQKQILYASVIYNEKVFMFKDGKHQEYLL